MRWLWWQRTDPDRPWGSLPLQHERQVLALFDASTTVEVGNGRRALFWRDAWLDGKSIRSLAPDLLPCVAPSVVNSRTVADALCGRRWTRDLSGPLHLDMLAQYLRLWVRLDSVLLSSGEDRTVWRWTATGEYSARSAYRMLFQGSEFFVGAKLIWKSWAPRKVKFFAWQGLIGRLWTADRRRRHGLQADGSCAFCSQLPETTDHLLLHCVWAREIWWRLLGVHPPLDQPSFGDWWLDLRGGVVKGLRRGLDSLILLAAWTIWVTRNSIVFNNSRSSTASMSASIWSAAEQWCAAGAVHLATLLAHLRSSRSIH